MADELVELLCRLARVPSAVPLGSDTLIDPDDPILVEYVQQHLRPEFTPVGAYDIIDVPGNQFALRFGNGSGPVLALMVYTPTQHNNLMSDPWSGRIRVPLEYGIDEPCVIGQGVSQNKVHQACAIELARWIVAERIQVDGMLFICVNNEGRSSHDCSYAILDTLPVQPDFVVQLFPTKLGISIGNRGRIDIYIEIFGEARHSSNPPDGLSVIDAAARVTDGIQMLDERLRAAKPSPMGLPRALVYQMTFAPLAPHTLPNYGKLIVDRRLLPEESIPDAVMAVSSAAHEAVGGYDELHLEVTAGVCMLPAVVEQDAAGLRALSAACKEHLGSSYPGMFFHRGTFDAGGPLDRGIATVMFGAGGEESLLGDDFVRISHAHHELSLLKRLVKTYPGAHRPPQ